MSSSTVTAPGPAPEAPEPVTPVDLIGLARDARKRKEQADYDALAVALEWAVVHEVHGPVTRERSGVPGGPGDFPDGGPVGGPDGGPVEDLDAVPDALLTALERASRSLGGVPSEPAGPTVTRVDPTIAEESEAHRRWRGLPDLEWDCAAPLAAPLGQTTRGGWVLLRQALTLRHRLPRVHSWWAHGQVHTRVAQRVADKITGQPDDVCAWVDARLAARIRDHRGIGPMVAERLVEEAMAELHAEELELRRQEQLQARYARYAPSVERTDGQPGPDVYGLAEFVIRGDWPDVKAFNDTIAALAEAIRTSDHADAGEPLNVRRSVAVGILADPTRALAMLTDSEHSGPSRKQSMLATFNLAGDPDSNPGGETQNKPGRSPVTTDDVGRAWLDTVLREWAGRPDVNLTVRPVIHCGGCPQCDTYCHTRHQHTGYTPTELDRERIHLMGAGLRLPPLLHPRHPDRLRPHRPPRPRQPGRRRPDLPTVQPRTPLPPPPQTQDTCWVVLPTSRTRDLHLDRTPRPDLRDDPLGHPRHHRSLTVLRGSSRTRPGRRGCRCTAGSPDSRPADTAPTPR